MSREFFRIEEGNFYTFRDAYAIVVGWNTVYEYCRFFAVFYNNVYSLFTTILFIAAYSNVPIFVHSKQCFVFWHNVFFFIYLVSY